MKSRFAVLSVALFGSGILAACSAATDGDVVQSGDAIIGGFVANGRALDGVGTVGFVGANGSYEGICSASLITPKLVLTAKHCAMISDEESPLNGMKFVNLTRMAFAVGPDASRPTKVVEAIATDLSPVDVGGLVALGNDVALFHLIEPITDVALVEVATRPLGESDLGSKFQAVGYGSKDNREDITGDFTMVRRAGQSTLRALEGKAFQLMYGGDFEALMSDLIGRYGTETAERYREEVRGWWENTELLKGYEAWVGDAAGDVQTCHGDSGGPLLRRENGKLTAYAVVSGGWFSRQLSCAYGTFYATLGEKTQTMIAKGRTYEDPCAGGLTAKGRCDGDVAVRCTDKWEGDRRATRVDCAELGQGCFVDPNSEKAGCFDEQPVLEGADGGTTGGTTGDEDGGAAGGNSGEGVSRALLPEADVRRAIRDHVRGIKTTRVTRWSR